ncbi:MAG: acyltransferase [Clostridiales bacterium]|jgi:peptidoglycan/LPS O-acetylase OafA/YrhL|nr:acyltransferase [Clostridiales bacterium]
MNNEMNYIAKKPHYEILDGLRGVAALMVVAFHISEAHTLDPFEQVINHGYLAVDFFYVLSGFVIGYAYDDRWGKMSVGQFFKRRLIRLHPLVVMGMLVGAALFYFGGSTVFPLIQDVPLWKMLVYMLLGMLLIPMPPSMDIRGWEEMYTLDAPAWTLFYEYIANALYALFIRKFSKTALAILVFLAACATVHLTLNTGDVIGGWSFDARHLRFGFTRLIYPFFAGLLLYRIGKLIQVKHAFLWCSLLIITVVSVPRIGGTEHVWMNGLYESFCIIVVFPLIVFFGASGQIKGKNASRICKFLGDISFPLYITHYPIMYLYIAWISDTHYTFAESFWVASLVMVSSIALAYACLKLYDEPVRRWLSRSK